VVLEVISVLILVSSVVYSVFLYLQGKRMLSLYDTYEDCVR
jgi:hypothetical protein